LSFWIETKLRLDWKKNNKLGLN